MQPVTWRDTSRGLPVAKARPKLSLNGQTFTSSRRLWSALTSMKVRRSGYPRRLGGHGLSFADAVHLIRLFAGPLGSTLPKHFLYRHFVFSGAGQQANRRIGR